VTNPPDPYQQRYLEHQERKRQTLIGLLYERHSERVFDDLPVPQEIIAEFKQAARQAPSSCNRQAVTSMVVTGRDSKEVLGGLMVGGVGWIHRAPAVLLLFADGAAYKAGDEVEYMPYLDAGVIVGQWGVLAPALGLVGCYVNPNIRSHSRSLFDQYFEHPSHIFCGAYAIGYPRPTPPAWVMETS